MRRVVSLLPSATETVHALGCADQLVGRSHECDHPAGVEALPVVTEPKAPLNGDSAAIDRAVRTILEQALSVYRVDTEALRELAPEVVLTQSQCEVCAVSADDVEAAVDRHLRGRAEVVALEPNRLEDVFADIRRIAAVLEVPERGDALVASMTRRIEAVRRRTADLAPVRVATVEWIDPLMAAGNWMPELVAAAGGVELFGSAGEHSPWLTWEELRRADPDVILILPCGFGLDRTRAEAKRLQQLEGWSDLQAVRAGRVYVTDGNRYFNRPGPRLAASTEILAELLHPDVIAPEHEHDAWERLT